MEVLIIGSGIAGLSAGLTAARLGRRTLIVTGDALGGHLLTIEKIDGYPGFPDTLAGYDLCPIVQEQAMAAGAEIAVTNLTSIERIDNQWRATTSTGDYQAPCVILATGTRLRMLGIPGEAELRGKGVSHCASCDAPLLRDRPAVVAGGGDSALQEALTLAEHCSAVTIVHHGANFTAQAAYCTAANAHPKISARPESELVAIVGADGVESVRTRHLATQDTADIECAGVFVFTGLEANTAFFADDAGSLDADGYIVTDAAMRTAQPGLLAAGTVRSGHPGRAAAAAGDGTTAARTADRYLVTGQWLAQL